MAKKETSATKEFKLPEALVFGYSFMMFSEHVVDRVPEFQSVTGARKGAKVVDAVEAAEKSEHHIVTWPSDLWEAVCRTLESDQFRMPQNYMIMNGTATDRLVPMRAYLSFADAILGAEDTKPKSPVVEELVPEAEAPQAAAPAA